MQSFIFDFKKSPSFLGKWNKEFDVEDINTNCFYIVLVDDSCNDNIEDCLNPDGQLDYAEEHLLPIQCSLKYETIGTNSYIRLDGDVDIVFPYYDEATEITYDNFNMKGVFITTDSGYVMGYSINTYSMNINTEFIIEDGITFWSIIEGELYGE